MDPRISKEVSISNLFDQFIEATTMRNVLSIHHRILNYADLSPCEFSIFFPRYKRAVTSNKQRKNWKAKALFSKIDKRAAHKCYSNTKSSTSHGDRSCDINAINSSNDGTEEKSTSGYDNNNALQSYNCLVIGSGPAGLRTAIELQLLGATKVCIVEKRSRFSRNNVLHLWPFVIDDLKSLGAKKFYGKFCAGSIDHISIRQIQLILLKVCLMVGCDFRDSCSYIGLCPDSIRQTNIVKSSSEEKSSDNFNDTFGDTSASCSILNDGHPNTNEFSHVSVSLQGSEQESQSRNSESQTGNLSSGDKAEDRSKSRSSRVEDGLKVQQATPTSNETTSKRPDNIRGAHAHFESDFKPQEKELHSYEWDIIIGADGRRNTLSKFFPRKEFRGRLAIAITANFINRQTQAETSVPEISGLSFIYNQDMFNALAHETNIQLENICYYKDDTHYFVMTAKKRSLLERGVLIQDHSTTQDLLSDSNVNKEALLKYAKDAAYWTTGLEPLDFALNHYGQEDCAMFDFTSMYAASNACKALRTNGGGFTLVSLVGDSLLEPFWPTGSGCARGFLSSFDAAWMCRQWAVNKCAVINYHATAGSSRAARRNESRILSELNADSEAKIVVSPSTYDRMALSVMAERESIYRILAQTTSENLQQNYSLWTLNPHTRYPNLNRHLVLPSQVEHLISDGQLRVNLPESANPKLKANYASNIRRVKSPNSLSPRKSPKKLKSAGASPQALPKNLKNRSRSLSKYHQTTRSRHDLELVDSYIEFEESYRNLADSDRDRMTQYLNYRHRDSTLDDLFIPSLSGTLPSSNNLSHLEARRARDIDDCLRQRRQKSKINVVRDQLVSQLRGDSVGGDKTQILSGGNAVLFNEIKRLREQQTSTGGLRSESKSRDISGPLSLLNSMRRCASFAERVKSFENKLVQSNQENQSSESNATTPKTPIDNVKNLPQFATLQELIVNNGSTNDSGVEKSRIPVTKLSKEDWNVKCWESKLKKTYDRGEYVPARPRFNKSTSVECNRYGSRPQKQFDVFQERIKEMAEKLKTSKENDEVPPKSVGSSVTVPKIINNSNVRSQGWINHLKKELVKGSTDYSRSRQQQQLRNHVAPNKPIKKLFEDDDEDDDGIDVNKHYDHLCVNRPTNKYLAKGSYTSHLARPKFNSSATTRTNDSRLKPAADGKKLHQTALTSRGSSASSTLSDYSTNTGNSSSGSNGQQKQLSAKPSSVIDVDCARCKRFVSTSDRITIEQATLHRVCLTCADCGITLRSNEIQHYLNLEKDNKNETSFYCAICKPEIRAELRREAGDRLAGLSSEGRDSIEAVGEEAAAAAVVETPETFQSTHMRFQRSREEFFNSRINYNELYKNILPPSTEHKPLVERKPEIAGRPSKVTPSPIQITLPMNLLRGGRNEGSTSTVKAASAGVVESALRPSFRVANRETINGSELVTLILPPSTTPGTGSETPIGDEQPVVERDIEEGCGDENDSQVKRGAEQQHDLIDEEELQRILHLDNRASRRESRTSHKSSDTSSVVDSSSSDVGEEEEEEDDDDDDEVGDGSSTSDNDKRVGELKSNSSRSKLLNQMRPSDDDSSSLELEPDESDEDNYDEDEEENVDPNSTCNDFASSEEFEDAPASDKGGDLHHLDRLRASNKPGTASGGSEISPKSKEILSQ